jgi:hypothetical protein
MLVGPVDGGTIASGGDLLLTWTSVGVLSDDEWYVVTLTPADGSKAPVPPYWTKSTSWRLQHDNLNSGAGTMQGASAGEGVGAASAGAAAAAIATPPPVQYTWQVQVYSGTPGNPGPVLSPPSAPRRFTWQ